MKVPVPADLPESEHEAYCLSYWMGARSWGTGRQHPEFRALWPEPYDAGLFAAMRLSMNWKKESE